MVHVKGGTIARKRHKRVLKLAKGHYGLKHTLFKTAKEQVTNSYNYVYRGRCQKRRDFRKLWIAHINTAARMSGLSYSELVHGLKVVETDINRKTLADLAANDVATFTALTDQAKEALAK